MKNNKTCVYRFYDNNKKCLYIGITENIDERYKQHLDTKKWFNDVAYVEHSDYINRNEAKIYEIYYISKFNPIYNTDHAKFTNGFNLEMKELIFKEYKENGTHKRIRESKEIEMKMIESLTFSYMRLGVNTMDLNYEDIKNLYNLFSPCDDAKIICKAFSNILNDLNQRFIGCYNANGAKYYTPTNLYKYTEGLTEKECEMLESDSETISLQYNEKERIKVSLLLSCNNVCKAYGFNFDKESF